MQKEMGIEYWSKCTSANRILGTLHHDMDNYHNKPYHARQQPTHLCCLVFLKTICSTSVKFVQYSLVSNMEYHSA